MIGGQLLNNIFTLTNLKWKYITDVSYNWTTLLNIPINSESPYGNIEFMGDQQIMSVAILTTIPTFKGMVYDIQLSFNDGRTINII